MILPRFSSFFGVCLASVALCAGGQCQDVTYDNLTLTDGPSTVPSVTFLADLNDDKKYEIRASQFGMDFLRPNYGPYVMRIESDALTKSLVIDAQGLGVGTTTPDAPLHLYGNGTLVQQPFIHPWILVEDNSATVEHRILMVLANNGGSSMRLENTNTGHRWETSVLKNGDFRISLAGTGGHEFRLLPNGRLLIGPGNQTVFDLQPNGNLIIKGALAQQSDRNAKENFAEVDCQDVLDRLLSVPVQTWNYKTDDDAIQHMGPMAQDFYGKFGLGFNDTTISTLDTAGVTFAAIKALDENNQQLSDAINLLKQEVAERDAFIQELKGDFDRLNATFEERIGALETLLNPNSSR